MNTETMLSRALFLFYSFTIAQFLNIRHGLTNVQKSIIMLWYAVQSKKYDSSFMVADRKIINERGILLCQLQNF